jgi:glycosyltransferase involved in cell wall biosynthesis
VWTARFCFNRAQRIICVSSQLKDHLIKKWQLEEGKVVVMPNAADTEAFGKQYDVKLIRCQLGLQDEPIVMFVGGFYLWHDLELLVMSFADVLGKVPHAKLLLVGDGRTRANIEQIVESNGLEGSVMMVGPVKHHQVPEMLAVAAIAVAPNIPFFDGHGGSPLKIFEYMAAGKAIVATRTGQVAEIIQDGENGILVEAGDRRGLAEAIVNFLNDASLRDRLGQQARQQAVEQHSWQQYARQLEGMYATILQGRSEHNL